MVNEERDRLGMESEAITEDEHITPESKKRQNGGFLVIAWELVALAASIIALCVSVGTLVFVIGFHQGVLKLDETDTFDNEANIALDFTDWTDESDEGNVEDRDANNMSAVEHAARQSANEDEIIEKALAHDALTTAGEYAYNPENNMIETWYSSRTMKFPEYQMRDWSVGADGVWRDKDGYVIACAPSFGTDDIDGDDAEKMADKGYVKAYERGEEISTTFGLGKVYDLSPLPCVITDKDGMRYGFMSVYTDWFNTK